MQLRTCLCDPAPEIFEAARLLEAAVSAHLRGDTAVAGEYIRQADMPAVRAWTTSLWGPGGPWSRPVYIQSSVPSLPKAERSANRMPVKAEKDVLLRRDGFHCRFCGIPLIRKEVRALIREAYPQELYWGDLNEGQHAAFQAMWLQYDHIVPHARGGSTDQVNLVLTCAPCNYGRWNFLLDEVGLLDPRERRPIVSAWDGLESFRL
jgi:hypothetical protein